ncbi:UNKNOWN [Stylonychia lemnae]|uniref:Uncharacterized protein n=1 Tax=Stylonychia lemnae TaxID=5949 RepID=A0A078ABL3_STYLE|nr:UNKNOWN [Stylonychia lemnae]|eukprot:CDW78173.1 UNKNOWN [Stylonychia lemnae]
MTTMTSLTVSIVKMAIILIKMLIQMYLLEDIKINAHQIFNLNCVYQLLQDMNVANVFMDIVPIKLEARTYVIACLNGYVDPGTGKCVTNCGIGRYGNVTFGYKGMIESTECLDCDSSCFECKSQVECKSCKKGYFLNLTEGKNTGACQLKQGQFESVLYVQSKDEREVVFQDGSKDYPFNSIVDALTKAYKIGSPYRSATIQIILFSNQTHSMQRYNSNLQLFDSIDISQSIKIIIDTVDQVPTKVYYKLRDKFTFLVGAGLTIRNIEFDATDSILDQREGNIDLALLDSNDYQCLKTFNSSCCNSAFDSNLQRYLIMGPAICQARYLPQSQFILTIHLDHLIA